MKIRDRKVILKGTAGNVKIQRMPDGFPRIEAEAEMDLHYGLGYLHGHDRQMQMWLLKIIGQGRASELLKADDQLIELDKYMRWINLAGNTADDVRQLPAETAEILKTYCRGVNDAVTDTKTPFEFKLVGYKPDDWKPENVVLITKMIGFVGLSQSQGDAEKFIIQMIRNDISPDKITDLFPIISDDISDDLIELIKQVKLSQPIIPESIKWLRRLAGFSASNNWAIGPEKTASGSAMLCGDPHLSGQLPSIFYPAAMRSRAHYMMGATLPGVPSVMLGRSNHLAWAVTYGTMDMIDYFIEEVQDKKYRCGDQWRPFTVREEIIKPKKKDPIVLKIYENDNGILEGEPNEDGYYLNFAWSARKVSSVESINNLLKIPRSRNAVESMNYFAGLTFAPFNWAMADTEGNIGYQLSGLFPQKAKNSSGLLPYLGWDETQAWRGLTSPDKNPKALNPETGIIVTANQNLNHLGQAAPMTLPMPDYRADRIRELLEPKENLSVEDMKMIQYDRYSKQAEAFMEIIKPMLPATENGDLLRNWDRIYDSASLGATLFERIYLELIKLVFGENGMGVDVAEHMINETPLFAMLHGNFDRVLLQKESAWFGDLSREQIYQRAIERGLRDPAIPYGQTRKIYIPNIFFAGQLPKIFGFDYGPWEHIGSRATVAQSQIFTAMGHPATFVAVYRMIADMAEEKLHTNNAGGPSDRRFSKYYTTGISDWINARYYIYRP